MRGGLPFQRDGVARAPPSALAPTLRAPARPPPVYSPCGAAPALAGLSPRPARAPAFSPRLKRALRARRPLFAPAAERRALAALLAELLR